MKSHNLSNESGDEQQMLDNSENESINDDFDEEKWYDPVIQMTKSKLYSLSRLERLKPIEKKPQYD